MKKDKRTLEEKARNAFNVITSNLAKEQLGHFVFCTRQDYKDMFCDFLGIEYDNDKALVDALYLYSKIKDDKDITKEVA